MDDLGKFPRCERDTSRRAVRDCVCWSRWLTVFCFLWSVKAVVAFLSERCFCRMQISLLHVRS